VRLTFFLTLLVAAALSGLYYGWFRDSSLVRVSDVSVVGLTGPDAPRLRARLKEAAGQMTTLNVDEGALRAAVATEPSILSLRVVPDFPHGLRIDVLENHPVAAIQIPGSGVVPIAGNGVLMPDLKAGSVPELRPGTAPRLGRESGAPARVADERALQLVRVAGAAPPALIRRAATIERRPGQGIVVTLRNGPPVIFGDDSRVVDKWRAAAGVLASRDSQGATYVDVRLADRPVAGGLRSAITPSTAAPAAITPAPVSTPAAVAPTPSTSTGGSAPVQAPAAPVTPATTPAGAGSTTGGATATNTQP
jgi:cell division protein FtsQ